MTKNLYVRNLEQAACMLELDGQISDGMWENSRPLSHWEVWCEAKVVVAREGEPLGRDFRAIKSNYNFTNKNLLDVVAKRMLAVVRIARAFGLEVAEAFEHAPECASGLIVWTPYNIARLQKFNAVFVNIETINKALRDESYSVQDLLRDLKDLKAIIKVRIGEEPMPTKDTRPVVKLLGGDSNAYAIVGACIAAARKAGWPQAKIDEVRAKMMSGDYNRLLCTAMDHFNVR